jgi:uncharacterized protein (DUF433 family)
MNWHDHIHSDPKIFGGKPVIKGTRISVEIILDWLAAGWTEAELLENYPRMSRDALLAVYAFLREIVGEQLYAIDREAA